ncbi:MAG: hypothetical protein RL026_1894 [Pseudomonadota bacterium]
MTLRPRQAALLVTALAALAGLVFLLRGGLLPANDAWAEATDAFYDDRPRAAERLARQALAERPLDGRAYAVLAQVALQRGESAAARRFVALALRHAPRDANALMLAADLALEGKDPAAAVAPLDHLLRLYPQQAGAAEPQLLRLAAQPAAHPALLQALQAEPPWRDRFLRRFANEASTRDALPPLFEPLAAQGGLRPAEMAEYLGRYVREGEVAEARRIWTRLAGQAAGAGDAPSDTALPELIWDGGFELAESLGSPFEWQVEQVAGVEAGRRLALRGSGHHLRLAFAGRRAGYRGVRQLLTLPPGRWQLSWESRYESLETPQGLRWALRCVPANTELLATPPRRGSADWRRETAAFTVPAEGCAGQWLQLELHARIPAETQARGTAWFDNLAVEPTW